MFVYSGFMKGSLYLELPEASRAAYAMGILDGLFGAGFYGADPKELKQLQQCTSGMTNTQLMAVFDQHVRANPVNWQHPTNVLAFNALLTACPNLRPGA